MAGTLLHSVQEVRERMRGALSNSAGLRDVRDSRRVQREGGEEVKEGAGCPRAGPR